MVKEAGPTFIKKPSLNQSDDGRILTFSCQIAGEPRPNFKWILGDKEIKSGGRYRSNVKKLGDGYQVTLEIEDVSADDAGSYKIVADNKYGNTSATIALKFGDAEEEEDIKPGQSVDGIAPNFTMKPKMKQSEDGVKLTIETELCADPAPEIKWYRGDKILKDGGRLKLKTRKDGEYLFLALEITDVSEDDGGEYKIIAKNKLGSATNTIKLNFARGGGAPSFTMKPRIEQSDDGRMLTFHCELTADPKPTLTWYKGDKQLSPGGRFKMSVKAQEGKGFYTVTLNINDVTTKDGGNYKVVAKNEHGEAKSTIELNFEGGEEEPMDTSEPPPSKPPAEKQAGAPKFIDKPSMRQANDGHRVTFECMLTADPAPQITWYRNLDIIKDKGRWRIKETKKDKVFTETLIMDRVTPDDSGTYICYAKNKAGDDKAIINLNFDVRQASTEGAPTFIEQPNIKQEDDGHRLVMEVKVLADPEPEITWHFNNLELRNKVPYKIRQSKQGTKVYICVLEVSNITQKDQGNYKVVAENTKGKASSTMAIKFEVKDYKKPRNFTLSHQVAPMQIDFATPMDFEFGPEGPIRVGGGFNLQKAEFEEREIVTSSGLIGGEIPFDLPNRNIEEGDQAQMQCKVAGKVTKYQWMKDGKEVKESSEVKFIRHDDVFGLDFAEIFPEFAGLYELITDGPKGKKTTKCEMKVKDAPPEKKKKKKEEKKKEPARKPGEKAPAGEEPVGKEPPVKKAAGAPVEESAPPPTTAGQVEMEIPIPTEAAPTEAAAPPAGKKPVEEPVAKPVEEAVNQAAAPTTEAAPKPAGEKPAAPSKAPVEEAVAAPSKAPVEEAVAAPSKAPVEEGTSAGDRDDEVESKKGVKRGGEIIKKKAPAPKDDAAKPEEPEAPTGTTFFIESPESVEVIEGQAVSFEAIVEGDPVPKLTWFKGPTPLGDGFRDRYSVKYSEKKKTHSLDIRKTEKGDRGKFSCVAENENGKDERVFALTVKEKPASDELDFRSMLKKRSFKKEPPKEEAKPDWGTLKEVEGEEKVFAEITAPMKKSMFVSEREGRLILDVGAKWEGCKPKWFKNGKEIIPDKKTRVKTGKNETSLIVSNVNAKEDSAMYKCAFENLAHSSCKVTIEPHRNLASISTEEYSKLVAQGKEPKGGSKPKVDFVTLLKSVEVVEGADAKFSCELSGDALKTEWLHKDMTIPKDPKKYETKRLGRRQTLIIKKCTGADIGEVILRIDNRDSSATLGVKTAPKFLKDLQPVTVVEKNSCAMECEVSDLAAKVKWFKGSQPLKMGDRIKEESDGNIRRLIFEKAIFDDAGDYVCKFENIQSTAKLKVDEPPKFGKDLEPTKEAFAHEDAVFETKVTSPAAEVFWFKDGEPLEADDKHEIISDGLDRKLIVHDCAPEDQGRYACAMDEDRKTFSDLAVEAPPSIEVPPEMKNILVKRGEPAEISLGLGGSPPPEVKWSKDGEPVVPDKRIQELTMPDSATLLVTNTGLADAGEYEVSVTNKHGTVTEKVNVIIIDKPAAPASIKVKSYDETWVRVGWEPPANTGNCDIDHYFLQYREGKKGEWQVAEEKVNDTEYTVSDLTTGKEYWFRVAAVNQVGRGAFRTTGKGQVAKEPMEPPDQMVAPKVVETHDGEISLEWEPPAFDGGKPITGYILEKREPGGRWSKATKQPIDGLEHTVSDLPVAAPFEFRVSAVNKAGESEPSPACKAVKAREPIDCAAPPGTPVVEDVTKNSVDLSWEKPASEGGAPISGYHVEKKNPDTGDWERVNDKPITATRYKVPEEALKEGEETAFRVVAENEAGMSEPSETTPDIIVKDPEIPPSIDLSEMKDVTVKAGQNFKLSAKFKGFPPPSAKWSKGDQELTQTDRVKIRGIATETELTQLDSEREDSGVYSLTCENPFGKETATCNVTILDKPKPPKGPVKVTDVFANSCVLSWEPPEDDGGMPLSNYVIEKRDASRAAWGIVNDTTKECTIKVPKLVEGVEYLFRVSAENQMGVSRHLEAEKPILAKNPYDEPGAPGIPEVVDWDNDFVELEWAAPENDGGAPIEGYIIEKKEKKSSMWMEVSDKPFKGNKAKVPKLIEGREYEFRVSAVNKGGQGRPSKASQPKLVKPKFAKPVLKIDRLRDITVKAGNKFELAVPFDGSPPPKVVWKKNEQDIKPSDHVSVTNEDEHTLVRVKESVREDSGVYELTLSNECGTLTTKCKVNVQGKPSAPEEPLHVTDITAESCKLEWQPPLDDGGSEITNYIVEKKEADDDYWTKVTGFCTAPNATITKLEKGKEYVFRVMAENGHGATSPPLESGLILAKNPYDEPDAPGKPKILSFDRDRAELEWPEPASDGGDKITGYTVEKKEPRGNRWIKCNKTPIIGNKHTVTGLIEGKQYEFRVVAENRAGPSQPSEESDVMTAKPMFEPPKIDFGGALGPKDVKVRAGEPFDIKIPFKGSPPPTATWYKDNKEVRQTERVKTTTAEEATVMDNKMAERADTGTYKVTLENNQGTDSIAMKVIVLDKPTEPVGPIEYSEFTRDSVKLKWQPPEDDGNGTISGYMIEKREANRDNWVKVTSAAPISGYTVQNLNEGHNYLFRVSAVNQYGVSDPLEGKQVTVKLPFDEPDAPSVPVVDEVDKNSARVSWTPPENDGGSPVTGYSVEVKDPDTGKWNKANSYPVKGTSYDVPNLEEGKDYQFRVVAENEAGPGKPSRASEAVTAKVPVLPADPPGRVKIDKVKKDNVALSWKKPVDDGGAPITDYIVEKRKISPSGHKGDWEKAAEVPAKETSAVVPDLQEGEKYEFRVAAKTEAGPGKFTNPTPVITAEDKPEAPVLNVGDLKDIKVKGGEKIEIKLRFTGVPVPEIKWTLNGEPVKEENIRNTSESTTLTVPSASIFDAGRYAIVLKNPSGVDSAKCKVSVLDAPDAPSGPLRVSDVTPETCTISWKPPKVGAEEVENYIIEKKDGETGQWKPVSSFCPGTHFKLRNLKPGEEYQFRVSAENPHGVSKPITSDPIIAKHPFDAPGSPDTPEAKETDSNSITIGWSPPVDDGGSPVTGYLVEKREAGASKWVPVSRAPIRETTCTVPKLIEGNEYEFRVKAVNAAGEGKPSDTSAAIMAHPPPVRPKIPLDSRHKDVTAIAGDQYKVEIPFQASPAPEVVITRDDLGGQTVSVGDRQKVETLPDAIILVNTYAEREDTGKYTVTLKNDQGSDKCTVRVTVVDKPGPPEGPLAASDVTADSCKLSWKPPKDDGGNKVSNYIVEMKEENRPNWTKVSSFVRSPQYEVGELDEGVSYNFRVRAENEYGVSEPLEMAYALIAKNPYERPDPPGKPVIKDVDKGYVNLSWTPPEFDGGSRILGYNVEKRDQDFDWAPCNDYLVKDTAFSLSNLQSANEYEFRVLAKNQAGWSHPSKPSDSVVPKEQFTVPDKPGKPHPSNIGKDTVELAWTKPISDGGSPIKGYTVEKKEKGHPSWVKANSYPIRECQFTVPDLEPGKEYEFRVAAVNAAGEGEPTSTEALIATKPPVVGKAPFFEKKLTNQKEGQGGAVKFECVVTGTPEPEIHWYRNGVEMFSSNRQRMRKAEDTCTLVIDDIREPDSAEYICEAQNKHGTERTKAKLEVQLAPEVSRSPNDITVEATNPFKVKIPFKGTGNIEAKCSKDGEPVEENDRIKMNVFDDYVILNVKDTRPEDAGAFKVTIANDVGGDFASFNVSVLDRPSKPKGPLEASDITDHTLTLAWKPPAHDGGSPVKNYVVHKKEEGKDWATVGSFIKGSPLNVHGLTKGNAYLFRVAAENDVGQSDWLEGDAPIIAKNPFDPPGQPGTPDVEEIGKNFVSLAWTRPEEDGGSPITGYDVEKAEAGTDRWVKCNVHPLMQLVYNVPNLIEDRKYEFRIFAVNVAGRGKPSSASNSVTVKDPNEVIRPKFVEPLQDQTAVQGRKVTFECRFIGKPKPDIRWFKGPRELYNNNKILTTVEGDVATLTISDLFGEDQDDYSCELENPGGKKVTRAQLTIKCPPKIKVPPRFRDIVAEFSKGETIRIKVPITGLPKPESSWSRENEPITSGVEATERHSTLVIEHAKRGDTGVYRITAENELGSDAAIIKIAVNDAPAPASNLRATDITYDSVELTWNAPTDDGGSSPTFIVDKKEAGSEAWARAASTGLTKTSVSMLTPNKEYTFRVRADNMYGTSEPVEVKHTIAIKEPPKPKKIVIEEEEEERPKRPKLPKVHDYDTIVEEGFTPTKVKLSKRSPYDKYIFGEELGRGPYGVILRAMERATGRNFAAKFIDIEPGDADHLRKEIDTCNRLQHPRLAQLYDAFETTDPHQFVLIYDFLSGGDAFQRAGERDYLTEEEVARYTKQVCQGLNHIHTRNYMHLDLKPQAVLYETKRGDTLKIIDMGLATKLDPEERTKVVYRSTDYAAPEILDGSDVGFNTDMWTVGVICYMLLSGINPFGGDRDKVRRAAWEFDRDAFKPISEEAKDFISRLLVKEKDKRMAAHEALEHPWLQDPSKGSRIRIPTDRHRELFLAPGWLPGEHVLGIGRLGDTSSHRRNRPQEKDFSQDVGMDRRDARPRFIKKPREALEMEDRDGHFTCQIAAASQPLITWQRDGKELKQSLKHKTKYDDITYGLTITRLTLEDAGNYMVHAKNSFGEISHTANLSVTPDPLKRPPPKKKREEKAAPPPRPDSKPHFDFRLRPRSLQENDNVRLSCIARGYPEPKITWLVNGKEIERVHPDYKQTFSYRLAVLEIDNVKLEHAGIYTCVAENTQGTTETEARITVEAKDPAKRRQQLAAKKSSKTTSEEYSSETSSGRTTRRSKRIEEEETVVERKPRQSRSAKEEEIDIDLDDPETEKAALKIQGAFKGLRSKRASKGETAAPVQEQAPPPPEPEESEPVVEAPVENEIPASEESEESGYKGPVISQKPSSVTTVEGKAAVFTCTLAEAADSVEWLFGDRQLEDGGRFKMSSDGATYNMEIPMALETDSGDYTFKAKNSHGDCQANFSLKVSVEE